MSEEWDIVREIGDHSNAGDQAAVMASIDKFLPKMTPNLATMAISAVELTKQNIADHRETLQRLADAEPKEGLGIRECFRFGYLRDLLEEYPSE